jgi:hypothetical protein
MAASPEPWLARHLGVLSSGASPALREEYGRRAAAAAAYREAAGITDPQQAVSPGPHRGNPELEGMRQATIRALEIRDEADIMRGLTQGELEARVLDAERAQASAPPGVSTQLRLTAQAEADAWQQPADAATRHDEALATGAETLASHLAAERQQLEAVNARYEQWSTATSSTRETAAKARAELERRGLTRQPAEPQSEPPTMAGWWQQLEADIAAADRALEREHQATIAADAPWPPQPERAPQPSPTVDPQLDGQAARLDELLGQAAEATERLAADNANREARTEYAARIEREAQAVPEHTLQAQPQDQAEIEL